MLQAHQKEFEELTGIKVGSEQIPEQQQRPKVAMEMASGRPSFDVVNVAMHVQKRLIEKGRWMEDLRPLIADKNLTAPGLDMDDFSPATIHAATGADGKINVLPMNQDLFIIYYNKAMFDAAGLQAPKTYDEMMEAAHKLTDKSKGVYGFTGRGLKNANVVLYDNILLGWDQETITPDGKTLLTDTPAAIEAAQMVSEDHARMRAAGLGRLQLERVPDHLQPGPRRDVVGRHRLLRPAGRPDQVQDRGQGRLRAGAGRPEIAELRHLHRRDRHPRGRQQQGRRLALSAVVLQQDDVPELAEGRRRHAAARQLLQGRRT